MLGLHRLQHLRCMSLQKFDEGLSFPVHSFDAGHALVRLVPQEVHIAHQPQSFQKEDLGLYVSFFPSEHHVAKLRGHHLGEFQAALRHVALDLQQGLGRILHPEHGIVSLTTIEAMEPLLFLKASTVFVY